MRVLLLLLLGVSGCAATDETTPRAEDHFDHALAAARDGALDRAEEQALMALKLDPRNAKAHHLYAFLLAEQNRPEEAIVGFKRSLSIDPTSAATLYDLGTLYLRQGDALSAARMLERAVELRAGHAPSFNNLARAYYQLGLPELAGAAYEEALELDPENEIARSNLDLLLQSAGAGGEGDS